MRHLAALNTMHHTNGWTRRVVGLVWLLALPPASARADHDDDDEGPDVQVPVQIVSPKPVEILEFRRSGASPSSLRSPVPATPNPTNPPSLMLYHRSRLVLSGPGVTSTEFDLKGPRPLRLDVTPGVKWRNDLGVWMLIGGSLVVAAGGVNGVFGLTTHNPTPALGPPGWLSTSAQHGIAAAVLFSVGAAALISGGVLCLTSTTTVKQRFVQAPAQAPASASSVIPAVATAPAAAASPVAPAGAAWAAPTSSPR